MNVQRADDDGGAELLPRSECTALPTGLRRMIAWRSAATARAVFILESMEWPTIRPGK